MERSEPTFVPEWLKNSGSLSTSHQFQSSSLHSDEQGASSKLARNKSSINSSDSDLGRHSIADRTTSSYFRRTSSSNGSSHLRSYGSFGRNHRDRDYPDPLGNILPSRFEKDGLRRTHSSLSGKRGEPWPKKVLADSSGANRNSHNDVGAVLSGGSVKTAFERDFPSLGAEEKQADSDIGRVPSPGLSTTFQNLPIGNSAVIGGDGWTSALAEVPVIVGCNGSSTSGQQPIQPTSVPMTTARNMAETLAQGPPRAQTAPQLTVGTQRLEELAVKQSRQLIPMTPSMPKALVLNSSDKPKPKVGQLQLQGSHVVNHTHSPRPVTVTVKPDVVKPPSTVGKLHVLKPSRERNGVSSTAKDNLSPTGGGKLPNCPLTVPSAVGPAPPRNSGNNLTAAERKPGVAAVEKRPSSQAQSRNDFFNLVRKKSMTNNSSPVAPASPGGKPGEAEAAGGDDLAVADTSGGAQQSYENNIEPKCNGETRVAPDRSAADNGKNHLSSDAILYSEEEEARFLRSLGWEEETAEEDEGLTEEEISSFYRNVSKYLNLQPSSKIFKGTQPKLSVPLHSQAGNNGDLSSDSKLDA